MTDIITLKTKALIDEFKSQDFRGELIVNSLKEHLQYYVLNFIYNHPDYSKLVMYGGTLLRMCHKLDRMSEDLDFQTDQEIDLEIFKKDLMKYFENEFGYDKLDISINFREHNNTKLITLNFRDLLSNLDLGVNWTTLKLRVDINYFKDTSKFRHEFITPDSRNTDSYTFSIRTYSLSTLMASKVAAVLLRDERNTNGIISNYKGRDIYDLIWYMRKKTIPDIDYIKAKNIKVIDILSLFDEVSNKVLKLDDKALKEDLIPLFYNSNDLSVWFDNWRDLYRNARNQYSLHKIKNLSEIHVWKDFATRGQFFRFLFETENDDLVVFTFILSEYFIDFSDVQIDKKFRNLEIEKQIVFKQGEQAKFKEIGYEYIGLFYSKIINFLDRNHWVVTQDEIKTKFIRYTTDRFDNRTQVIQDKRLLVTGKLEDLL